MANMSYCMFENTSSDMRQLLNAMQEARDIDDLDMNEYEQDGFRQLFNQCKRYINEYNRLAKDFE